MKAVFRLNYMHKDDVTRTRSTFNYYASRHQCATDLGERFHSLLV